MKNKKLKIISLFLAISLFIGIRFSSASFFWHGPEGKGTEIRLDCETIEDLKKQTIDMMKIVRNTSNSCWEKSPLEEPKCITYHMLMDTLHTYWIRLEIEGSKLCKEARAQFPLR